jgi:hypothetical protein
MESQMGEGPENEIIVEGGGLSSFRPLTKLEMK